MIGLAAELLLIVVPLAWQRIAPWKPTTPEARRLEAQMARMRANTDSVNRGLLPPPAPLSDSARAAVRAFIRDSLGFELVRRGDTLTAVPLTPHARAMGESIGRGVERFGQGLKEALRALVIILAVIYLPIPLALTGITGLWLWQRRRVPALPMLLILAIGLSRTPAVKAQAPARQASATARMPSEAVTKFLQAWIWDSTGGRLTDTTRHWSETWAIAAPLPLERHDLRAEAVYLSGRSWCGTSGCALVVVTVDSAGTVRVVGDVGLVQLPIQVLSTNHAGLPDLAGTVFGGGVMRPHLVRLRYDGKQYPDDTNDMPEVPPAGVGRPLLTDAMPETRLWPPAASGKLVQRCFVMVRTTFGPMYTQRRCPSAR